jgi:hypothetical protein
MARSTFGVFAVGGARNAYCDNRMDGGGFGVALVNEEAPTVSGNRLTDLLQNGILVMGATQRCNVVENRILRCGSTQDIAVGIRASNIAGELHVESNEIMDTGLPPAAGGAMSGIAYGIDGELILEARIESNLVTYSDAGPRGVAREDRALRLQGFWEFAPGGSDGPALGFAVQIANNKFIGPGATALVELRQQLPNPDNVNLISRFERVLFNGNYCFHFTSPNVARGATVSLVGRHCTIGGNQVKAATPRYASYDVHGMPGPFIGNASHFGHSGRAPAIQFPNPESAFNTIA